MRKDTLSGAIKWYVDMITLRASGDDSPKTCNELVDSLSNLKEVGADLEKRLEELEDLIRRSYE